SGIGAPAVLKAHHIPQIVDLPGVGENYNDHNLILVPFHTTDDSEITVDEVFRGKPDSTLHLLRANLWLRERNGIMALKWGASTLSNTTNSFVASLSEDKIRPNAKDLEVPGPTFRERWQDFFADQPNKPGTISI
ncbi:hypothetical protein C8R46DRAFT_909024, partial [Mycena filopes]